MPLTVKVSDEIMSAIPTLNEGATGIDRTRRETDKNRASVSNLQRRQDIDLERIKTHWAAFARDDHSGISARGFKPLYDEDIVAEELGRSGLYPMRVC